MVLAVGFLATGSSFANADTRSLKLYFVHTREKAEIVYKRNGRYDQAGLQKINRFLRDWRRNEPTRMDPRLLDLVWEAYRQAGSSDYIHVISGYRSPATNSMLRSRSKGVAKKSQHMLGKAMDFYLPDVKLKRLRDIGLRLQGGGVGYYPRSGSPFVHMDVGNVRHWPKMSRQELVAVFPSGKTLHVPSDGKPLPGFEQAMASYKARRASGNLAIASAGGGGGKGSSKGLLAAFFGGGADEEEDNADSVEVAAASPRAARPSAAVKEAAEPAEAPAAVAVVAPVQKRPDIRIVPPELARPAELTPPAEIAQPETPEAIVAALPKRGVPVPGAAPRPQAEVGAAEPGSIPFQVAAGIAGPEGAEDKAQQVALGIPLPTHRPDYSPPPELDPKDDAVSALLAMADPVASDAQSDVPLPTLRPGESDGDFIAAALPASQPTMAALSEANPIAVAPADATTAAYAPEEDEEADPFGIPPSDAVATSDSEDDAGKSSRILTASISPRAALATRQPGSDPAAALASGVKTTAKSARPRVADGKPDRKPVVVAAQPQAARWALHTDKVTQTVQSTTAPSFAYNIVRTAPREVYTAGFQSDTEVADANRFTGKAVEFLSVARFNQN